MLFKMRDLKTMTMEKLEEKMAGCPCFPRRRRKVHHRSKNTTINHVEDERRNLKLPDTPTTPVENVRSELQMEAQQSETLREKAQRRDIEEESKTREELLSSSPKIVMPPDAIVNKGREFSYKELADATNNFKRDAFLGEGGFGEVYKGKLESTGQVVAVKKLSHEGVQGNNEFYVEVTMLSLVCHPNIVTLIGYCSERDQRLLVYEFMPFGSLEQHLHCPRSDMEPLNWNTRMKIAMGAARGLDYLHNHCKPCIIYRDMKSANILLGEGYHAKLSDLGLAKFGPSDEKTHVSTRVMGTWGYCAPEYGFTGQLTIKSDTYSFGVVLLELVTGRRALYKNLDKEEFLIEWAKPMLIDKKKYVKLADPRMKGQFVHKSVRKAVELSLMCMNSDYKKRPDMSDVVDALDFLVSLSESLTLTAGACTSNSCCSTPVAENEGEICQSPISTKEEYRQLRDGQVMTDPVDDVVKKKDEERAKAVAEAKMWGEQCRQDAEKLARSTPL